ncbi:hypothetical protein [uncultured Marixanthomonas sp.]|uniref:hypothetical protein n=1 Tax=uncultured Marixanthomonas sp. TaxID=757245 RepID=UPI0030D717CD|tara:strand:+ start:114906 stop:116780 length:1875 start_codon:yes stop_codon:yes gene_type:complete
MKYNVNGRLHAAICDENKRVIANTKVRAYSIEQDVNAATAYTAAQSKEVAQVFEEKQIKVRKKQLLAETKTNAKGEYKLEIDGKKTDYNGGAIEIVLYYDSVPDYGQKNTEPPKGFKPFEIRIDIIQPKWRETENGLVAVWNYTLLKRIWCYILQRLDIWVICGTLLNCKSQAPLNGIEVTAMDDDIITDDRLGSAVTDANGQFCIYYRSIDFKKTFLSPWINVETTPPFSFDNGPDVYFTFSLGGELIDSEPVSEAQKPSRKNVGHCLCVTLCLDDAPQVTQDPPAAFYQIGYARKYHPVLNIDPATGRTTGKATTSWNEQAFYSTLDLRGSLSEELNGNPVEYKFQYAIVSSPDTDVSTISSWTDVTKDEIANTVIASRITQLFPVVEADYYAIKATGAEIDVPFNGNWIQVPQYSGGGFDLFFNGSLIKLVSSNLVSKSVNMSGLTQGESSVANPSLLEKNTYIVLRMRKREVGSNGNGIAAGFSRPLAIFNTEYLNVPQGGSWLPGDSDNERGIASLDLQELIDGGGCSNIANSISVNYTATNPNLGNVWLTMTGPNAVNSFEAIDFPSPGEEAYGTSNYTGEITDLKNCAYEIKFHAELNLTDGENQHHNISDRVIFCR